MTSKIVARGRLLAYGVVAVAGIEAEQASGGAWATLNYREINSASGMCWRSWAVMDVTNKVQGICDVANNGIEPPTTNAPHYLGDGDELSINPATPPAVGYNGIYWTAMNQARGRVMGNIETSVTQQRQALYRIFSDYTITGAAYYVDGPQTYLDAGAPPTSNCFGAWAVNIVNPAYAIPGFGVVFPTNGHLEADALVMGYGDVGTTPAGGNNHLADSMVSVRWENVTLGTSGYVTVHSGTWLVGEIPLVVGSGEPVTNELRFVAVGNSPRAGLPVSQEERRHVLGVPEPSMMIITLAGVLGIVKKAKTNAAAC